MKTARIICGLVAVCWSLACWPALAQQRIQFATPVEGSSAAGSAAATSSPTQTYAPSSAPSTYGPPATGSAPAAPSATVTQPGATPGTPTPAGSSSIYTPSGTYPTGTPVAPGTAVQPPSPAWDPYAPPGTGCAPGALLPQDPYLQSSPVPAVSFAAMQKVLQHIDLDYHWFAGHNGEVRHEELGINDVELSATFAFPLFRNPQTPLLISPGFAVHYWEGPLSLEPVAPDFTPAADLPAHTYDAYLDAAWNPQINEWFGGELDARIGVYSDFGKFTSQAVRFTGQGMVVLTFSPSIKIKAGVWYLNRNVVKLLPAGGICWTPSPDIYFNVLFPNPKMGKRLTTWGATEWWIYASGDYGGGKWQIKRDNPYIASYADTFDYNDIRVAVGLEFKTPRQFSGWFEVGGAFSREVVYQSESPPNYKPNNTVFARAGLSY